MPRIGVFVCSCGLNIASTIDVEKLTSEMGAYPGVVCARDYRYLCSDPGQGLIGDSIRDNRLNAVVVAACSPGMHESTFREVLLSAGLNPYMLEIANIREQDSWVHSDIEAATAKALSLVRAGVEKVRRGTPLTAPRIPVTKRALVIGGGISGIQAALDIADCGYPVVLVEKQPHIGGRMAQLSETFPTLDCAACILTPKVAQASKHRGIELLTYSEVAEVSGCVGNYTVKIRRKAAYVDWDRCIGCMVCAEKCPRKVPSDFDGMLGMRKAIGISYPQAVPRRPVIDASSCIHFEKGKCGVCAKACELSAIDFDQTDSVVEREVGAIIVATGYDLLPREAVAEYGYRSVPDVIDSLQMERLFSSSGPTQGKVVRPSDGRVPKEVVFVQCAGSRDSRQDGGAKPYCSKICCMYTAKHALLFKQRVPDGQAYVFYTDVRAGGKGYEEFAQRTAERYALYLRGRVSKVYRDGDKVIVLGSDTLSGKSVEIAADMVVLATGMVSSEGSQRLARILKAQTDLHGFFTEAHPKLRPLESITRGVFLAGCAQGPKDISEAVSQASGTASKAVALFSSGELATEPLIAEVDESRCTGCLLCKSVCAFGAIQAKVVEERSAGMTTKKEVASVNPSLCQGCGSCAAACRNAAMDVRGFKNDQILAEVDALCV